ncbi:hypothetical protein F0562_034905 [Nyssa sinensis]|uniref:Uncharacterized protein n=1 Tax=Nyssa sinensis TaxID=561372 RepID=A0A5J5AA30_9ASTE|nr:hypothetical protein F0562_034905 [Nyssa sinensis]
MTMTIAVLRCGGLYVLRERVLKTSQIRHHIFGEMGSQIMAFIAKIHGVLERDYRPKLEPEIASTGFEQETAESVLVLGQNLKFQAVALARDMANWLSCLPTSQAVALHGPVLPRTSFGYHRYYYCTCHWEPCQCCSLSSTWVSDEAICNSLVVNDRCDGERCYLTCLRCFSHKHSNLMLE